jgi:hypothetical protein
LTQEGDGAVDGEVNVLGVHQGLDLSPEEPKVVANLEEGKHRFHLTFLIKKIHTFYIPVFMLLFVHLSSGVV